MADLKAAFEQATIDSKALPTKPDNDALLTLYSLYKQATVGDVQGDRPGMMDFVGRAKYDAWTKIKGMSTEAAMQAYVDFVAKLKG